MYTMSCIFLVGLAMLISVGAAIASAACGGSSSDPVRVEAHMEHEVTDVSIRDNALSVEGETDVYFDVIEPVGGHHPATSAFVAIVRAAECFDLNVNWDLEVDFEALVQGEHWASIEADWVTNITLANGNLVVCAPLKAAIDRRIN